MITVFDAPAAGSARASCVFMARSYTGQLWVRNLPAEPPLFQGDMRARAEKPDRYWFAPRGAKTPGFQQQKRAMSGGLNFCDTRPV